MDTGACGPSSRRSSLDRSASRACTRSWPASPFSRPTRGEYGREDAPMSSAASAPSSVACSSSTSARIASGAARAGPSGAPLISASPSLSWSSYGATPRRVSASPAGTRSPSAITSPSPMKVWNRWHSGIVSPAVPGRLAGTTGCQPSLSRSAMNRQSPGVTPAWPLRKPVSRSSIAPRTTSSGSGSPTPTARPTRMERWRAGRSSSAIERAVR